MLNTPLGVTSGKSNYNHVEFDAERLIGIGEESDSAV